MTRILFCGPVTNVRELGASKVIVELAEEIERLGWEVKTLSTADFLPKEALESPDVRYHDLAKDFHCQLRDYLKVHADEYDVIDYDHEYLPFDRAEFTRKTLFVARSVLLVHHLETIPIPGRAGLKPALGRLLKGRSRSQMQRQRIRRAQQTVEQADLVNVSNEDDRTELVRRGIAPDKVLVIPYGINRVRRPAFDSISSALPNEPVIAFVGTFDYRKGARTFPDIVAGVIKEIPNARFKLLGVKGMFKTEEEILAHFPVHLRKHIDVVLRYKSEDLPQFLGECSVGMFPSYIEGMPFGILEMMAASLPVVAYRCPGPPMMLTDDYMVERGNAAAMARKLVELLNDRKRLADARVWAKERSQAFSWQAAAETTIEVYSKYLNKGPEVCASTLR